MPKTINAEEYLRKKQARIAQIEGLTKEIHGLKEDLSTIQDTEILENLEQDIDQL